MFRDNLNGLRSNTSAFARQRGTVIRHRDTRANYWDNELELVLSDTDRDPSPI